MASLATIREPRIKKSISLRPDQVESVVKLAQEERHGNVSLIFQRLLDQELDRRAETQQPRDEAA